MGQPKHAMTAFVVATILVAACSRPPRVERGVNDDEDCAAVVKHEGECGDPTDDEAAKKSCLDTLRCLRKGYRPETALAFLDCKVKSDCAGVPACLDSLAVKAPPTEAVKEFQTACKAKACPDPSCDEAQKAALLPDAAFRSAKACLDKPCDAAPPCVREALLAPVFETGLCLTPKRPDSNLLPGVVAEPRVVQAVDAEGFAGARAGLFPARLKGATHGRAAEPGEEAWEQKSASHKSLRLGPAEYRFARKRLVRATFVVADHCEAALERLLVDYGEPTAMSEEYPNYVWAGASASIELTVLPKDACQIDFRVKAP